MNTITQLPQRPIRRTEVQQLDQNDRLDVVPYGGTQEEGEFRIYALKLAAGGTAHALCYHEETGMWRRLATVDATQLSAADEQLDDVLDEWISKQYQGRFDVVKPQPLQSRTRRRFRKR